MTAALHVVYRLCTTSTGVTPDEIARHAALRWEDARGSRPAWPELDDDDCQDLIVEEAERRLAVFGSAPSDPRREPINHDHPSSPPHPSAEAERAHWIARVERELTTDLEMARGLGLDVVVEHAEGVPTFSSVLSMPVLAPGAVWSPDYLLGGIDALVDLLNLLRAIHDLAPDGQAALGRWIGRYGAHVARLGVKPGETIWFLREGDIPVATGEDEMTRLLLDRGEHVEFADISDDPERAFRPGADYGEGRRVRAHSWLNRMRWRQQSWALPELWRRGGRALADAVLEASAMPALREDEDISVGLVLIAVKDASAGERRTASAILGELAAQPSQVCEAAIRRAVDDGLVELIGGIDRAYLTTQGRLRYDRLVDAAQPR